MKRLTAQDIEGKKRIKGGDRFIIFIRTNRIYIKKEQTVHTVTFCDACQTCIIKKISLQMNAYLSLKKCSTLPSPHYILAPKNRHATVRIYSIIGAISYYNRIVLR